ncbi:MAG: tRNA (N(6)-L-threonylcarbamoyladenosine(37)-C(2))-methylthiotransferase MtaB [Desulfobulbaceae bacterium]|nr:tRNA (N(6)-L-threonylcarbamoyladenosine(37)-C(2))-methylthiotransferase MtaB [Desulfobulbaceae bacterium]HIJ90855.1 tRNA (N(6)-L-threonylcarbamoyladenosine(37)-C(2))-methylthiotransferase MtaB [Deltaproteobacteria bacterium]
MNIKAQGPKKIAISTLGCKVNQFESAAFLSELGRRQVELVPFSGSADVYIINTCAVTAKAGAQSRQLIRQALRANPEARLIVTGCYAQVAAQDILDIADSPICIVGNGCKHRLVEVALAERHCDLEMHLGNIAGQKEISPLTVTSFGERTRAYLKVQDGCNSFCSYCIVPYARGRSRSLAPDKVVAQAEIFAAQGYKEQVLTGIHLGHYGQDLTPQSNLRELLALLLAQNLPVRYRLSSLEPTEITDELLGLMAQSPAVMPYLHIPLQSGDDRILQRMNRRYPAATFAKVVEESMRRLPDVAIGVDVLVGFPGEDETAFRNTYSLIESLPVSYLHVFPYSKRPGTPAAAMPDQVPKADKDERVALLRDLNHKKRSAFYQSHLGSIRQILVERRKKGCLLRGYTGNYIPVSFEGDNAMVNQLITVRLEELTADGVLGRIV